ncbi:MAG: molybdate ABC transporter substrate-binding protein [Pontibacterium sp.]
MFNTTPYSLIFNRFLDQWMQHIGYRLLLCAALIFSINAKAGDSLQIAAASSLAAPLTDIGQAFYNQTGQEVRFTFASSSTLARQIRQGAPFSLFLSASPQWLTYAQQNDSKQNKDPQTPITFASNRLVAATGAPNQAPQPWSTEQLKAELYKARIVALADPNAVPLGQYSQEALSQLGLWPNTQVKWAFSRSARANLALLTSGAAPIALQYQSDVNHLKTHIAYTFSPTSHSTIRYQAWATSYSATQSKANAVNAFIEYLLSPMAQKVFLDQGFAAAPN